MIECWSSDVIELISWTTERRPSGALPRCDCSEIRTSRLRPRTISPARSINESRSVTLMRTDSSGFWRVGVMIAGVLD